MMRPGRSTVGELRALAERLEKEYGARETAAFIREAAEVYTARGLVAPDG
jgi:propanediol dehydratase small subunit